MGSYVTSYGRLAGLVPGSPISDHLTTHKKCIHRVEEAYFRGFVQAKIIRLLKVCDANVARRLTARAYKVSYPGKISTPEEGQIPVDDLMASIKGGKLF